MENQTSLEVKSSFEAKVTISPEDLTMLANYANFDKTARTKPEYESIDKLIESKLKNQYEGKCSRSGYVLRKSVHLMSRSIGMIEKGRFTGDILYYAEASCKVYQPPEGVILSGTVTHKNRMGIYVDYNNHAIRIMCPRDLHIGDEEFDTLLVGDIVKVEIKKSRYQVNDVSILSVGVFKGKATKTGFVGFTDGEPVEGKEDDEDKLVLADYEHETPPEKPRELDAGLIAKLEEEGESIIAPADKVKEVIARRPPSSDVYFYADVFPAYKQFDPLYPVVIKMGKNGLIKYKSAEHFMQEKRFLDQQSIIKSILRSKDCPEDVRVLGSSTEIDFIPKEIREAFEKEFGSIELAIQEIKEGKKKEIKQGKKNKKARTTAQITRQDYLDLSADENQIPIPVKGKFKDAKKQQEYEEMKQLIDEKLVQIKFFPNKHLDENYEGKKEGLMKEIQLEKFKQHPDLKDILLKTGKEVLVYADPIDNYWGIGSDGKGLNKLGEILMFVRDELAKAPETKKRAKKGNTTTAKKPVLPESNSFEVVKNSTEEDSSTEESTNSD